MRCLTALSFWSLLVFGCGAKDFSALKEGDIIFQTSLSSQSRAIQLATHSPYSHMGILLHTPTGLQVFEAGSKVKFTPLPEWIARGEKGHFVVKRLRNAETLLTLPKLKKLRKASEKFKGKPYDLYFEWSNDRIYCSELVWKIYKESTGIEVGSLKSLKDFDLSNDAVKAKMYERYKNKIPFGEKVISPQAMFESNELQTVSN